MDDIAEALLGLRDGNPVINAPEKNLLDKVSSVLSPSSEQPKLDAVLKENASEGNTDTTEKKKRKKIKKKVNAVNEIQSMHQMEMNMGSTEEIKAPANGNLGASDENESEKNLLDEDVPKLEISVQPRLDVVAKENTPEVNTTQKKKWKKKVNIVTEIQSMHQMEMNTGSTEDLMEVKAPENGDLGASHNISDNHLVTNEPEKNLSGEDEAKLEIGEQPRMGVVAKENGYEGNTDTTKKNKRKKKVNVDVEIQCMHQMAKNMGSIENLMEIKAQMNDKVSDYHVVNNEPEKNLPGNDEPMLKLSEQLKLNELSKENVPECSTDITKKQRRKKKEKVINEIQCMHKMGMNVESTENLVEMEAQMNGDLGVSDNMIDYLVVNNVPEKNLPSKDVPMLELSVQSKLDVSKENASESDTTKKKKRKKKVTVVTETQCMDQTGMNMGSTENHMEIKAHVVIKEPENNLPNKDVPMLKLSEQPKLDDVSKENASECGTDMTKKKKQKKNINVMSDGTTENHMEIKAQMNDHSGASDNMSDYHVVDNEPKKILPGKDVPMLEPAEHPALDAGLVVNASEETMGTKKKKKKPKKKVSVLNEVQSMDQMLLNAGTVENVTETIDQRNGTLEASNDVSDCHAVNEKLEMNLVDKDLTGVPLTESNLGPASTAIPSENTNIKKKKKRKGKKANITNEVQNMNQVITENIAEMKDQMDCDVVNNESKKNLISRTVLPLSDHTKLDAGPRESVLEGNTKTKKRRRGKKKVKVMNEVQSTDQMEIDTGTAENIAVLKDQIVDHVEAESENKFLDLPLVSENHRLDASSKKNAPEGNTDKEVSVSHEVTTVDKTEMNTGTTDIPAQSNMKQKRKWISKKTKKSIARKKNEMEKMNPADAMYKILLPAEEPVDAMFRILLPDPPTYLVHEEKRLHSRKPKETALSSNLVGSSSNKVSSESVIERTCPVPMPMKLKGNSVPCESQDKHHLNQVTEDNDKLENGINEIKNEKRSSEGVGQYPKFESVSPIRRKLLVLDVNGLLADIVMPPPKDCNGDVNILRRAIFKRPFCDDFLNFCFQNFDVGIWSSRSKVIFERIVDYLLGNRKDNLLFCWNMSHATPTGSKTLDNIHKPLVCKELKKIWEIFEGYDESNTLLLDDSPYKALLNPVHTAIFPSSFHYNDKNDNSLGPGGDLRVYLEGLLSSDNVQEYVEQNPFGQGAIDETDPSWEFYSGVLQTLTNQSQNISVGTYEPDNRLRGGGLEFVKFTNRRREAVS